MKTRDIVLIPFPFAELTSVKVRPAVVICETKDKYKGIVVSAISSIVPKDLSENEILIRPGKENKLKADSMIKVDRIVTVKRDDIIAELGKLEPKQVALFKTKFKNLVNEK
ncbi:MAG TPA: type II toxin-antitoxin system PemK/MazF family toxin [Candidatus Wunengus sp. YC60]|uniref:type II toxin-antitoxin system PemK/MazF family toxin n=1 Tax=Candidatus Wunengus sp. YC60 TaxID=3367697 RepID=UPI004026F2F8